MMVMMMMHCTRNPRSDFSSNNVGSALVFVVCKPLGFSGDAFRLERGIGKTDQVGSGLDDLLCRPFPARYRTRSYRKWGYTMGWMGVSISVELRD
jgi:hypothetical protein